MAGVLPIYDRTIVTWTDFTIVTIWRLLNEDEWNKQSVIGRLFGADNRPKHYRCSSKIYKISVVSLTNMCITALPCNNVFIVTGCGLYPTVSPVGNRTFPVTTVHVWNSLPGHITSTACLPVPVAISYPTTLSVHCTCSDVLLYSFMLLN